MGPSPARIEAVMSMETPRTKCQVREFLGLERTLESWTHNISVLTKLLRQLARKDTKFMWSPELEI